jgi:integrase
MSQMSRTCPLQCPGYFSGGYPQASKSGAEDEAQAVRYPSLRFAVAILREHRRRQLELWLALGHETLVFRTLEGDPIPPNNLSRDWARFIKAHKLPAVSFHALRHRHASALIAEGIDVLTISRRIGHASPVVTLGIDGYLFSETDRTAAKAIEAALRTGKER